MALVWEIWRRRRGSACLVLACRRQCAFQPAGAEPLSKKTTDIGNFSPFFGILMVVSFLFLKVIFNYTENSNKEWSGFPYRLFVLPLPTWQLVLTPVVLGVLAVEANYYVWIKLVWTHEQIERPEWFAVVLGVYVVLYQATLWSLAAFRVARLVALASGGISIFAVACMPFLAEVPVLKEVMHLSWVTEGRLIVVLLLLALVAFGSAWAAVARQQKRVGSRRRHTWIKVTVDRLMDALLQGRPRISSSPAAAMALVSNGGGPAG